MKEIALYDAKNTLSALIQEVEETGAEILITRHGKPAAKLTPAVQPEMQRQAEALARIQAIRDDVARRNPNAPAMPWEELKALMRDEEKDAL